MLVALEPHLREPLCQFKPRPDVPVPQPTEGTLVLLEVARLDKNQQEQLFRWLGALEGRVQVVSTTSEPLFSLVETGAFLTDLYYRLNVVRICSEATNSTAAGI
jgi:transcriptional regulator of acetoin/glycerol metabolism